MELLVLTMMIATVRLVSGFDWRPSVVFLQTKDSRRVEDHHLFSRSTVRFGNRATAIEIPQRLLARQLPKADSLGEQNGYDILNHEFPQAIRQVVTSMLVDGAPKIGAVADAIGASVRTLQRRLSNIDTTFSAILEEARMTSANRLMLQSDCTLIDIANDLGYSDPAHFTRAFRRWMGLSPCTYRHLMAQTASDDANRHRTAEVASTSINSNSD